MKSLIALPRPLIAALPLLVACGGAQTTTAAAAGRPPRLSRQRRPHRRPGPIHARS